MPAAVVVSLVELVCGAALVLGLFTRWASVILAAGMLVDVLLVLLPYGFFIANHGYEFALLRLAASLALALSGPGAVALDSLLGVRRKTLRWPRGAVHK